MLVVEDRKIERVHLIDNDPAVREMYRENILDMGLEPLEVERIDDLARLVAGFDSQRDGVLCDYQLNSGKYSPFNGDVVATEAFRRGLPVILCTSFYPMTTLVANLRTNIPLVINAADLTPESVQAAFSLCVREQHGVYSADRRPWRTLVRIEGCEIFGPEVKLSVIVPAWSSSGILVVLRISDFPIFDQVQKALESADMLRVSAEVNIGATEPSDLYFAAWKEL